MWGCKRGLKIKDDLISFHFMRDFPFCIFIVQHSDGKNKC